LAWWLLEEVADVVAGDVVGFLAAVVGTCAGAVVVAGVDGTRRGPLGGSCSRMFWVVAGLVNFWRFGARGCQSGAGRVGRE